MNEPLEIFLSSIGSKETRRQYRSKLIGFLESTNLQGTIEERALIFVQRGKQDSGWALEHVVNFVAEQKTRCYEQKITAGTLRNYYKPVKIFCDMNDIVINWKRITRTFPKSRKFAQDRAPTNDEIRKLVEYPDRRIKPIVYVMCGSGIRVGAWDYLKWGHIVPQIGRDNAILAAKLIVYAGEMEQYATYMTPEAYESVKDWMKLREEHGEKIGPDSWVMRDIFKTTAFVSGNHTGLASTPRRLKSIGVRSLLKRAWVAQGLAKESGGLDFQFKSSHGFRKRFKTQCELAGVKPLNVEFLLGHDTGIAGSSYYRPTEQDMLNDYLKAVPALQVSKLSEVKEAAVEKEKNHQIDMKNLQDQVARLQNQLTILVSEGLLAKNAVSEHNHPNQSHT